MPIILVEIHENPHAQSDGVPEETYLGLARSQVRGKREGDPGGPRAGFKAH
jgi:hypothetical protein